MARVAGGGMTETQPISFRFPPELQQRVDRYAASLSETAGLEVPRTRVVMKLIELGLAQVEATSELDKHEKSGRNARDKHRQQELAARKLKK